MAVLPQRWLLAQVRHLGLEGHAESLGPFSIFFANRPGDARRRPLFGVGMALSGQTAPYNALWHRPWSEPAAKNAHVDLRQPDCRALTVSGPVGDFAYRRAMGRRVCRQDDP
jgi:hypothetical protein